MLEGAYVLVCQRKGLVSVPALHVAWLSALVSNVSKYTSVSGCQTPKAPEFATSQQMQYAY
jgi:hypothetical protein